MYVGNDRNFNLFANFDECFRGFSITAPFKAQAHAAARSRDSFTEEAQAANTLVREADGWRAFNTDAPAIRETLERALRAAKNFAKDPDGWLLLVGDSGCGKTHLAVAIGGERLQGGNTPQFWPVPDLQVRQIDRVVQTYEQELI